MAIRTVGAGGDFSTLLAASDNIRAIGSLTENEDIECLDDAVYPLTTRSDLDFDSVTLNNFLVTLRPAPGVKHNGDFVAGARIIESFNFGLLIAKNLNIEDFWLENTSAGSGANVINNSNTILRRCICRASPTSTYVVRMSGGGAGHEAAAYVCRIVGGTIGLHIVLSNSSVQHCTVISASNIGIETLNANTVDFFNNVVYNAGTAFSGGGFTNASNNAGSDGTVPGINSVTLTGDPFADGFTPSANSQLKGAGVDIGIALGADNRPFVTNDIGAYPALELTDIAALRRRIEFE